MSLRTILGTLMVRPIQLLLEMLCSLFIRMSLNPGIAILCLSLVICLMVSPLKPKHRPDFRKGAGRYIVLWGIQLLCLYASFCWFTSMQAFNGVSFGPVSDLGQYGGLILFWAGYAVFALLRQLTKLGYQPMELNKRQQKTDKNNKILLILCCLYMAILTGIFIPSALIGASPAEFVDAHYYQNPAQYLLYSALLGMGTFAFWGIVYGMLLAPKARKRYTLFISICAVSAAVNYMFFGKDYGFISSALQYETAISNQLWKVLLNTGCVIAAAVVVCLLRKKRSLILRIMLM